MVRGVFVIIISRSFRLLCRRSPLTVPYPEETLCFAFDFTSFFDYNKSILLRV